MVDENSPAPVRRFNRDSLSNTLIVAIALCLVCATLVSAAAVILKPWQDANRLTDKRRNILAAAGLLDQPGEINEVFERRIVDRIINLETGEDITDQYDQPALYDQIEVAEAADSEKSLKLEEDPATIKYRENHSHVYIVKTSDTDDTPAMYVFPIRGKGLWSILKGFVALDADLQTIRGLTYYEHGETPGLGGEVDNPEWKSHWVGKLLFDDAGEVSIRLVKADWQASPHTVDALSGATITSRGVEKMLEFWMGEEGFGPYLDKLRERGTPAATTGGNDGEE
jgi:Na+-transporting NADH:ubiquinone oxidoreductase subunit C